jgi:hypothetical protein
VNWFLMPATVAVLFHVLRMPFIRNKQWNYIKWPLFYTVAGGISSFSVYYFYIKTMGYVSVFLNPKMHYPFFLYKLWPNTGYMGLLPNIVLLCLPLLLISLYVSWKYLKKIHWIRYVILLGILGIFFAGSTVVSLRAGGGYDMHNYDSFLLLLLIIGCFLGIDAVYLDNSGHLEKPPLRNYGILVLLLIIPVLAARPSTSTNVQLANPQIEQTLQDVRKILEGSTASDVNHPVLFIDQRQLLVFNEIKDNNIFVPYEKIELMEMAMARNKEYKSQFQSDVKNQKFSLIVSEILQPWDKPYNPNSFERDWYENNVWVDVVATPILNYYTPIYVNKDFGIAIYAPKE